MRTAKFEGLGRGVWVAPWKGPDGEMVLVALNRLERYLSHRLVKTGESSHAAADDLWSIVERDDPERLLQII